LDHSAPPATHAGIVVNGGAANPCNNNDKGLRPTTGGSWDVAARVTPAPLGGNPQGKIQEHPTLVSRRVKAARFHRCESWATRGESAPRWMDWTALSTVSASSLFAGTGFCAKTAREQSAANAKKFSDWFVRVSAAANGEYLFHGPSLCQTTHLHERFHARS